MTWSLGNKVETNQASVVIHHMMRRNKKGETWILYGHVVSKVLEHVGFNIKDEEFIDNFAGIRNVAMGPMRIEINNGIPF